MNECSDDHVEIAYQCAECPLCEALRKLDAAETQLIEADEECQGLQQELDSIARNP